MVNAPGALLAIGIHAIRKSDQTLEPRPGQMLLPSHRPHNGGKRGEVVALDDERMALEQRHYGRLQVPKRLDRIGQDAAPRAVRANSPAAEGRNHRFENLSMVLVLVDMEERLQLPAAMPEHHRTSMDRHGEATFTIHKTSKPVGIEHKARTGSFLLIVRTGWIFTAHADTL
jgi:hypothetical protein